MFGSINTSNEGINIGRGWKEYSESDDFER